MRGKIRRKQATEILFRRPVWYAVIVREIEMGYPSIKGSPQHGTGGLEDIGSPEILP